MITRRVRASAGISLGFVLGLALLGPAPPSGAHEASKEGISVIHPWMRASPGGVTVGVAYGEIKAAKGKSDRLVGAKTPAAARAEIHEHIMEKGVVKMRPVAAIAVRGGTSVVLGPSGHHIMLLDLKAPLKEGDLVPLTLIFEKAGEITIEATVEPIGAMGPHGFDHQPGHKKAGDRGSGAHKH